MMQLRKDGRRSIRFKVAFRRSGRVVDTDKLVDQMELQGNAGVRGVLGDQRIGYEGADPKQKHGDHEQSVITNVRSDCHAGHGGSVIAAAPRQL